MFCDNSEDVLGVEVGEGVVRQGLVEGVPVEVLLDTGSARTLVRKELVPEGKVMGGKMVGVRCAHGEVVHYPIAELEVVVGDENIIVKAGVSDRLPVQLLLGRDVPELFSLLATSEITSTSDSVEPDRPKSSSATEQIVAVTTRAQARSESEEVEQVAGGVTETPPDELSSNDWGKDFADDLFEGGRERVRQTRAQKRTDRRGFANEKTAHGDENKWAALDMTTDDLIVAQRDDPTLAAARMVAEGNPDLSEGEGFYYENDILYRRWEPKRPENEHGPVHQLVLPAKCRDAALAIAHNIPLGGHLWKTKTAQRLLRRFYWPTLFGDVAKFCRACKACHAPVRSRSSRYQSLANHFGVSQWTSLALYRGLQVENVLFWWYAIMPPATRRPCHCRQQTPNM